jgi:hypothetical protein
LLRQNLPAIVELDAAIAAMKEPPTRRFLEPIHQAGFHGVDLVRSLQLGNAVRAAFWTTCVRAEMPAVMVRDELFRVAVLAGIDS